MSEENKTTNEPEHIPHIEETTIPQLTDNNLLTRSTLSPTLSPCVTTQQNQHQHHHHQHQHQKSNVSKKHLQTSSSSSYAKGIFNQNLTKCYENLTSLKEKMKPLNHSGTQNSLKNQMFSTQLQKSKDEYNKILKQASTYQAMQTKTEPSMINSPSQYFTQETESYHISNQLLNKTNVDLVNTLKSLNKGEVTKTMEANMKDLLGYIDYLKIEMATGTKTNKDLTQAVDSLENKVELLTKDNRALIAKLELSSENQSNSNQREYEDIISQLQNENEELTQNYYNKDKECQELAQKYSLSDEMITSLKKTKVDYEDIMSNMKKTIQILSTNSANQSIIDLKKIIQDKDNQVNRLNLQIEQLHDQVYQLQKNESDYSYKLSQVNSDVNALNEITSLNDKLKHESELASMKTDQLYQIIIDKDNLIEKQKQNYSMLNDALIEIQNKQEAIVNEFNKGCDSNQYQYIPSMKQQQLKSKTYMNKSPSESNMIVINRLKANLDKINDMLMNATSNNNIRSNNDTIAMIQDLENQIKYLSAENTNLKANQLSSSSYDKIMIENERLKGENKFLRTECDKITKKFIQIINDQSSSNIPTTFSTLKAEGMMTHPNHNTIEAYCSNMCLYRIYDSKRVLRFDLAQKEYQIVEFIDYDSFGKQYKSAGSIWVNTFDGFFILTGDNCDMLFYYNNEKASMSKVTKLPNNHLYGSLIIDETTSSIMALSGYHNRKVHRYTNSSLIPSNDSNSSNRRKNEQSALPDMTIERSECGYLFYNHETIYAFFGYCYPQSRYIDTIEFLHINSSGKNTSRKITNQWEKIQFDIKSRSHCLIKSHSIAMINDEEVLILGGYDGVKETSIENLLRFDLKEKTFEEINRKLPNIDMNHCYLFSKESQFVTYEDENKQNYIANIDEMDNVHIIETSSLNYDLFKFD